MSCGVPKAILFDFGGTLDSDGVPWKERFYPIYREEGIDWDFSIYERFFHFSDDSLTEETLGPVGYEATLFEQVTRVLRHGSCFDASLARRIAGRFHAESLLCLNRNRPILERLAARYRLGIVSNFYGNLEFLCEEIGYDALFDTVIDSARFGVAKPHPAIFEGALEKLGCSAGEAVFVGDSPLRDMAAAKALAMPHVWLNTLHPERSACCKDDRVIRSLLALPEALQ
jgi:HAD superfamily hydrolase (TIGR01509 family)